MHYEKFILQLTKYKKDNQQFEDLLSKVKNIANEGYKIKPNNTFGINLESLDSLRKDKNIIITKPDKGKGVVILNRSDYINKAKEILDDKTKF